MIDTGYDTATIDRTLSAPPISTAAAARVTSSSPHTSATDIFWHPVTASSNEHIASVPIKAEPLEFGGSLEISVGQSTEGNHM